MQQYFVNKTLFNWTSDGDIDSKLKKYVFNKREYEDYCFANRCWDAKFNVERLKFKNCTFAKMGMKDSRIYRSDFHHTVFIDCYMKGAVFEGADFTGCKFINCCFENAIFIECEFQYATFECCFIPYDAICNSLPANKYNLTRELCRNLGLEALHAGNAEEFRKYFFAEKAASEKHYWKCFCHGKEGADKYYHDKYNLWGQINGLAHFVLSKINKLLWGYGERNSRLLINMILVIVGFAIEYLLLPVQIIENGVKVSLSMSECFYVSLCNFFTVSPISAFSFAENVVYEYSSVIETGVGVIMMGFFVAGIFRYINRRS